MRVRDVRWLRVAIALHKRFAAVLCLSAAVLAAPARGQDTLRLARLSDPIVVDGRVDEPVWESVPVLPLTQFAPQYRGEPSRRSEIRVAYDDSYVYVSGRMYADPGSVRANTVYRDAFASDDLMCILLDTYNDHQTAVWNCVNPAGGRIDQTLSNDGVSAGLPAFNLDWNSYWDAATSRDETGWFAEMRIPFTSLGFQDVDGRVVMGLEVYRFIGATNERLTFPDIPPSAGGFVKPSRMPRIVLEGVRRRQPVYVAPYVLGGWQRTAQLNGTATGFDMTRDYTHEAGLDLRYSPTANLSLDVTANTDFAQVEADDQQVNLTRFPLFFPEKRQFFQERAAIFDFGLGGPFSRLFHSRRIGLVQGQPIRLLGGVRLASRVGGADVGILDMQTASALGGPSENFGVVRLKQRMFNEFSTVGGMITTRVGDDGSHNVAVGTDALVRVVGDEYATVSLARTFDSTTSDGSLLDATHMLLRWERRREGGLSYAAEAIRSGAAFNPGVGFVPRHDFTSLAGELQYLWYAGPTSPFRTLSVGGSAEGFRRNAAGSTESGVLSPTLQAEFRNGANLSLTYRANYESVLDSFPLAPGVAVAPDDYWFHEGEAAYRAGRTTLFQPSITVTVGQFYDGHRVAFAPSLVWKRGASPPGAGRGLQLQCDSLPRSRSVGRRASAATARAGCVRPPSLAQHVLAVQQRGRYSELERAPALQRARRHRSVDRLQRVDQHRPLLSHARPARFAGQGADGEVYAHVGVVTACTWSVPSVAGQDWYYTIDAFDENGISKDNESATS